MAGGRPYTVATALLCLFLLLLLAFGQVAHVHTTNADADHCPLCIALHAPATVAPAATVIILVALESPVIVQEVRPISRAWHPTQFTRPPPASC